METNSVKNEFGDMVEIKPIIIVPDSLLSEQHAFTSNMKPDENLKTTNFHQDSKFPDAEQLKEVNTVDTIKRWTVSSSVVLPLTKTEDGCYIETADISTGEMLPTDSVKNEHTVTRGDQLCEKNEHTGQLEFIPKSDILLSPSNSNEHVNNKSSGDSEGNKFSLSTCITDGKEWNEKLDHALCRDVNNMNEVSEKMKRNSFFGKNIHQTSTLSSLDQSPQNKIPEFINVIQKSHTQSGEKPLITCHLCGKWFQNAGNLRAHNRTHTGEKPFKCDVCNKAFNFNHTLKRHQLVHTVEKSYKCDFCKKSFTSTNRLSTHQLEHIECDVPNETVTFQYSTPLSKHQRIQTGGKLYRYDIICNKTFTRSRSLSKHQPKHTGAKMYKCDVCKKVFSQELDLMTHQHIHTGERLLKSDVCEKDFTTSCGLSKQQRSHPGDTPGKCDVCNKTFTRSHDLRRHKLTHTGEKPYRCDICNKTFTLSSYLHKHRRTHAAEMPHKCDVCNKAFIQKSNLTRHQRIHTGEKPYKCDVCNKKFTRLTNFRSHQRMHTGEKPFKGDACDKEFSTMGGLSRHKRIHTGKKLMHKS